MIDSADVSSRKDRFDAPVAVFLGPHGRSIVASGKYGSAIKAFDSTGRRLWTLETRREIIYPTAAGWFGDQAWIADPGFEQIAIVERGELTKSLEFPSWIRPRFAQRKTFPVFGQMHVLAYIDDGSMIVVPLAPRAFVDAPAYDEKMAYVLKVDGNGIIQNTIARFPSFDYARRHTPDYMVDRSRYEMFAAPGHWPYLRVSPDGKRTVVVTVDTVGGRYDTATVTTYDDKGATIFSRKLIYPSRMYSEAEVDSLVPVLFSYVGRQQKERFIKSMSRRAPSVVGAILGRDGSVWITFREDGSTRPIVGLDAAGQVIGTLYAPRSFQLKAADRGVLIAADAKDRVQDIIRYSIGKL